MPPLDHTSLREHPELFLTALLQEVLGLTRRALAIAHPELGDDGDLGELDEACHLAILIAHDIVHLERHLHRYRELAERPPAIDDSTLPF